MNRLFVSALLLLIAAGFSYWWLERSGGGLRDAPGYLPGTAMAASQFVTAPVEQGMVRQTVTTTGTLHALVTVEVGTQLSGQVAVLFVDFNDEVAKDQPLAQLDVRSFDAKLAEAAAATAMAEANVVIQQAKLDRAWVDLRDSQAQRAVLDARLDNARVRLEAAQAVFDRAEALRQRGTTAAAQSEDARAERDQAAASLREAEAIVAAHQHQVSGAWFDLKGAEAELANAVASVPQRKAVQRAAEIDLERTTIRSPVDGVVVGRSVNEGQTVAASLESPTLFTIAGNLEQMEIHARVDEADIGKIAVGQHAVFGVDAYPGDAFEAMVTAVRKAADVTQNVVTYTGVLATENADNLLLPGMTATVRITVQETGPTLKLPLGALRFSPSAEPAKTGPGNPPSQGRPATVWRLKDGRIEPVAVGLGADDGAYAAILDGAIAKGDEVVVSEIIDAGPDRLFGIRLGQ